MKIPVVCSALFPDSQVDNIRISLQDLGAGSLQLCRFFQVLDPLKEPRPVKLIITRLTNIIAVS